MPNIKNNTLSQLGKLIAEREIILQDLEKDRALLEAVQRDLTDFSDQGDVRDEKALAALGGKTAQAQLLPARIQRTEEKLERLEATLSELNEAASLQIIRLFSTIQAGTAQLAAEAMREHFENLVQARLAGLRSIKVQRAAGRESQFRFSHHVKDPVAFAHLCIALQPQLIAEVDEIQKLLGDTRILSLGELMK
jgi:predicted ArsR family transcriptional regulator